MRQSTKSFPSASKATYRHVLLVAGQYKDNTLEVISSTFPILHIDKLRLREKMGLAKGH